jgi:hypothetical protein
VRADSRRRVPPSDNVAFNVTAGDRIVYVQGDGCFTFCGDGVCDSLAITATKHTGRMMSAVVATLLRVLMY